GDSGVRAIPADTSTTASANGTPSTTALLASKPVQCPRYEYRSQSSDLADNIWATSATCATATEVVAAAPDRPASPTAYDASGFSCSPGLQTQPQGGG